MTTPTMLVTGATDGIGRATALGLAHRGARVLVHGRSRLKAEAVVQAITRAGGQADPVVADLASLAEVHRLAAEVRAAAPSLTVLLHNAGVFQNERTESREGYELTFAVNHLAPFLLTALLLDHLKASAPARVVTVASVAHGQGRLDFDDLQSRRDYSGYAAYAASKLANVLFARALARRLEGTAVTSNALHPGVVTTKLLEAGFGMTGITPEQGAATSIWAATAPELADVSGRYFSNARLAEPSRLAKDDALGERLWTESARLVHLARPA